jgi:hypothetical protein
MGVVLLALLLYFCSMNNSMFLRKIHELGKFHMAYSFFWHNFNTFAYKLNKLG